MKLKVAIASVAVVAIAVVAFAFAKKPTTTVHYYFDNSLSLTRGAINPGTQVLVQSQLKSTSNWTTSFQTGGGGAYLNEIVFDQEPGNTSDGIGDGQYSLKEAIDAVAAEYIRASQYDLPTDGNSFTPSTSGASAITIGRASSN